MQHVAFLSDRYIGIYLLAQLTLGALDRYGIVIRYGHGNARGHCDRKSAYTRHMCTSKVRAY